MSAPAARPKAPQTPGQRLRGAARVLGLRRILKAVAGWLGFDLVKRHFYSPVPDFANISDAYWKRRSTLPGLAFDPEAQLRFVETTITPQVSGWNPPRTYGEAEGGFYLDNGTYGPVDAELLYGMVRDRKPKRVVEVGSGFSSLVIGQALAANRSDGHGSEFEIVDPYPGSASYEFGGEAALEEIATLRRVSILDVPVEEFKRLGSGDILFVDGTHTVKVGSDVNRVVLDVLPELAPGVSVHFHDVFLPREYPRRWVQDEEWYWAEQYLLQAFLAFNDSFEILAAANVLHRDHGEELARLIPTSEIGDPPLALWIRRVERP